MKYNIISTKNKWCIKKEGSVKALRIFKHRELAFGYAILNLELDDLIVVHNSDASVCFTIKPFTLNKSKMFREAIENICRFKKLIDNTN